MKVSTLVDTSIERAKLWHDGDINQWSTLEWAGAMCGEAGECANAAKKLRRLELSIPSINEDHMEAAVSALHGNMVEQRHFNDMDSAKRAIAKECCDTILYAVLVAASVGLDGTDLEGVLADVFNKKSEEYGFPQRLAEGAEVKEG